MKRALLLAAIGLTPLAACSETPEQASVGNRADMLERELEAQADNMEALAENAADADTAAALENAAANLEGMADNVEQAAEEAVANLR